MNSEHRLSFIYGHTAAHALSSSGTIQLQALRRGACFGFAAAAAVFLGGIGPGFLWGAPDMDVE